MVNEKFAFVADIATKDPARIEKTLSRLVGVNAILRTEDGFKVKTTLEGLSAREMNRSFLSALRRVEKSTTMRAEWTHEGVTERFLDYAAKGIREG